MAGSTDSDAYAPPRRRRLSPGNHTSLGLPGGHSGCADMKMVSGMLGHFSAGFTMDTYAHITSAAQRQAAQTMGNVLAGAFRRD